MATQINLSEIEWIQVTDLRSEASIEYLRKKGMKSFKLTYVYDESEEDRSFCPRCGTDYEDPDHTHICPYCNEDQFQIMDASEIPRMVYESLLSDYEVVIRTWDGNVNVFKLK